MPIRRPQQAATRPTPITPSRGTPPEPALQRQLSPSGPRARPEGPHGFPLDSTQDMSPAKELLMATPQGQKRARPDFSQSQEQHPNKKPKLRGRDHTSSTYTPEFWNGLSRVWFTRHALRELDRRNRSRPTPGPAAPAVHTTDLARFARHGGPDLRHLRGYRPEATMSSNSSRSKTTRSTQLTSNSSKTSKNTTPYSRNFEQHMIDHGVYPDHMAQEPAGVDEILEAMEHPSRPSLSPSRFDDKAFKLFQSNNSRAKDEDDVLIDVVPYITGPNQSPHFAARKTVFGNLAPLTSGGLKLAPPNPDLYYGARPESLDREVRDALSHYIVPSTTEDKPMAPNFFMEAKGPDGTPAVAARQALYDGAVGARAMHALQNHGEEHPTYDGKAYTLSSVYQDGQLKLYAHHITQPKAPGERPEYHMTRLRGIGMMDSREDFVRGATAFRNARDWAQRHRDSFIQAANAKAGQLDAEAETTVAAAEQYEDSTSDEFVDCEDAPIPVVDTDGYTAPWDVDRESAPLRFSPDEQLTQESTALGAEPAMSFATSFTSSFTTVQNQPSSKRNRDSPPSEPQARRKRNLAKKRPRPGPSQQAAGSSVQALAASGSTVPLPTPAEQYWFWSGEYQSGTI